MPESEEEKALKLLSEGIKSGNIDIGSMRLKIEEMDKIEKMKALHKYAIYEATSKGKTVYRTNIREKGGKRYCIQRESKEELLKFLSEFYVDGKHNRNAVTFFSLYQEWFNISMESSLDKNTIRRYEQYYKRYYEKASWVKKPIKKVSCLDLEDWAKKVIYYGKFPDKKTVGKEGESDLTRKEYTNMTVILRQIFRRAFKSGEIEKNPVTYMEIKLPFRSEIKKTAEVATYSKEEATELVSASLRDFEKSGDIAALVPPVLLMTGGRDAEVLGLKWSDIAEDWKTVTIRRQYKVCSIEKKGKKWITENKTVNHTKSSRAHRTDTGVRPVPVIPQLKSILEQIKNQKTIMVP